MLRMANVGQGDVVYDLGSGDGRIPIAAVKEFGAARGVGVELDPARVQEANENARRAGVRDRVEFRQQDVFDTDIRPATVVALYIGPAMNLKLRPKLLAELKRRIARRLARVRHGRLDAARNANGQRPACVPVDCGKVMAQPVAAADGRRCCSAGCASAPKPIVSVHGVVSCPDGAADALLAVEALQCWFPARHGQWRTLEHESHYDVLVVKVEAFDLRDAEEISDAVRRQPARHVLGNHDLRAAARGTPAQTRIRRVRWSRGQGSDTFDFVAPVADE